MRIQVKLLNGDAQVPLYSTAGAAGCDFFATEDFTIQPTKVKASVPREAKSHANERLEEEVKFLFDAQKRGLTVHADTFATTVVTILKDLIESTDYSLDLGRQVVSTGVAVGIPIGSNVELELRSKSGLAFKLSVNAFNGTLDEDYEQEVNILVYNFSPEPISFKKGDKVAQGVFKQIIQADFQLVDEINREVVENKEREANASVASTVRDGGFGSTGTNKEGTTKI